MSSPLHHVSSPGTNIGCCLCRTGCREGNECSMLPTEPSLVSQMPLLPLNSALIPCIWGHHCEFRSHIFRDCSPFRIRARRLMPNRSYGRTDSFDTIRHGLYKLRCTLVECSKDLGIVPKRYSIIRRTPSWAVGSMCVGFDSGVHSLCLSQEKWQYVRTEYHTSNARLKR